MINNKQRQIALENRQEFKGNNSEAFYNGDEYIIRSYNTIIYSDSYGLDYSFYSHTTRILQKQIKQAYDNFWKDEDIKKYQKVFITA